MSIAIVISSLNGLNHLSVFVLDNYKSDLAEVSIEVSELHNAITTIQDNEQANLIYSNFIIKLLEKEFNYQVKKEESLMADIKHLESNLDSNYIK